MCDGLPSHRRNRKLPEVNLVGETVNVKRTENEALGKHQLSAAASSISADIARVTRLNRLYVALCMISCVGLFGLLVVRLFLFK